MTKILFQTKAPRGIFAVKHKKNSGINYVTLLDSKKLSIASTTTGVSPMYDAKGAVKKRKKK